jgi:intracellular sulfur oxidation DsrE/DsrF family protein
MKVKAVFHLDRDVEEDLNMALNNISNLLKEVSPSDSSIYLVANGHAVKLFEKERLCHFAGRIAHLSADGVRFLVCKNSLIGLHMSSENLHKSCEVVPAGIMELVRFQHQGFAYIKP